MRSHDNANKMSISGMHKGFGHMVLNSDPFGNRTVCNTTSTHVRFCTLLLHFCFAFLVIHLIARANDLWQIEKTHREAIYKHLYYITTGSIKYHVTPVQPQTQHDMVDEQGRRLHATQGKMFRWRAVKWLVYQRSRFCCCSASPTD
jgi:hypothetical protein